MPLDSLFLSGLAREIAPRAVGAAVDKIHEPTADTVILSLRGKNGSEKLLLCGGTGSARIHFTAGRFENPDAPPMFCMLLRKHLVGARIVSVTQPQLERAVDIALDAGDAMGDRHERHLIVELISSSANIILTDEDMRITDCLRRVSGDLSGKRQLLPGLFYRPPEKQEKADPFAASPEEMTALLRTGGDGEIAGRLLELFSGLSPLICREAVSRAYGGVSVRLSESGDMGQAAVSELRKMLEEAQRGDFRPCILFDGQRARDFSFTDITQYGDALKKEYPAGFSETLDAFYTRRALSDTVKVKAQGLMKTVKNARKRLEKKLSSQKTELLATYDRENLRQCGDLIMANLAFIPRGASSFSAEDFYGEEGAVREIKLDPAKSPQQNAAKYYKDFNRAKNAEKMLVPQIENGEKELQYLESVIGEIERASGEKDLSEIRRELEDAGYIKAPKTGKKIKRAPSRPMVFMSDGGFYIRVGRTGTQNDELTRSAGRTDIWLHTQKIHGSHVVISGDGEPDEKTILQAARLAAYYSQARGGTNVPVDYTQVRFVKKPSGARPGMVIYTEQKTVYVTPDEAEAERLRRD
ncbi:MAG: NFACT family protein [Oscillospiraceae bacterium]|nr:NFACT family protein [Oscillospiraceae bacterium]